MRKVERLSEPDSLRDNKKVWTDELLSRIKEKGSYSKVEDSYKERYRQPDVKDRLEQMYSYLCCYCESHIGVSDYPNIEHLRPKGLPEFHHLSFEWDNLHWCCEVCNTNKHNKWNEDAPIIDPCRDNPQEHLLFVGGKIMWRTPRGKTTIEHTNLNRDSLVRARRKLLAEIIEKIEYIRAEGDMQKKEYLKEILMTLTDSGEEYCSFISHLVEGYLNKDWVK